MPDDRTTDEKVEAFRSKFPERVAKLNAVLLPLMGVHARTKLAPETLNEMVKPLADKAIAATYGLE